MAVLDPVCVLHTGHTPGAFRLRGTTRLAVILAEQSSVRVILERCPPAQDMASVPTLGPLVLTLQLCPG